MSETTGFPDFKRRKDRSYLQILNRIILSLVITLVFITMLAWFYPAIKTRGEQRAAVAKIRVEVEEAQEKFIKNKREVDRLRNDPEYLGLIARDKLELMREGETIFRFDSPITNNTAAPSVVK